MRILFLFCLGVLAIHTKGQPVQRHNFYPLDINADGIKDVIFTETVFDEVKSKNSTEQVFNKFTAKVFLGSTDGLANTPLWTFTSNDTIQTLSNFNFNYDMNNDGIKDLLAIAETKAAGDKNTKEAIAVIFLSKDGLIRQPVVLLKQIDVPGRKNTRNYFYDYNRDGFADLIVCSNGSMGTWTGKDPVNFKTQIMYGSTNGFSDLKNIDLGTKEPILYTGYDYNGDNYKDMLVEKVNLSKDEYFFISGKPGGEADEKSWLTINLRLLSETAYSLYPTGDINGDGYSDVAIIKLEADHNIKKNHVPAYTFTVFPGSKDGLRNDTMLYHSFYNWKEVGSSDYITGNISVVPLKDFDGNGSADLLLKHNEFFEGYDLNIPGSVNTLYKQTFFVWGGNAPQEDSTDNETLADFIHDNRLYIISAGDINGDKKDDLLLYNKEKQFVIYGNKERNFIPVEWKYE
jgi:hypothetical protein